MALSAFTAAGLTAFGVTASTAFGVTATGGAAGPVVPVDLAPGWPDGGVAVAINDVGQVVVVG
nr:hypothetical protein [Micromonospora sp. DSM 115978]